jgi:hypothetical protein
VTKGEVLLRKTAATFAELRGLPYTVQDTLRGLRVEFVAAADDATGKRPFMASELTWIEVFRLNMASVKAMAREWDTAWNAKERWMTDAAVKK